MEQLESGGLKCSCVVEHVRNTGEVLRKQVFKSAMLDLGRNEVEDIVLKLSDCNGSVLGPYTLREHSIHKRFLKDGKATIILIPQKVHLLISNCPPYHLSAFIQNMSVKVLARGNLQGSHQRMLGDISLKFNEISPLTAYDIEKARNKGAQLTSKCQVVKSQVVGGKKIITTPHRQKTSQTKIKKRKFSEINSSAQPQNSNSLHISNPAKKPAHQVYNKTSSILSLSAEQVKILELVKNGESVFFTGSAGTGKSHLLKRIIHSLPPDTTYPTASTGAAACLIGGTTLHAFAGIGTGTGSLARCIDLASRDPHASTWKKCQCLIIDEISMVDADFFDKMEVVARSVRNSKRTFGGIQLVVCGDFLQLPPVSKEKKFCFQVPQ